MDAVGFFSVPGCAHQPVAERHLSRAAGGFVETQADNFSLTFADKNDPSLAVTINLDPVHKPLVPVVPGQGTISYQRSGNSLTVYPAAPGALPMGFVKVNF